MSWASLLLADPSPCLRTLVLKELLYRSNSDPEVQELTFLRETDQIVTRLLSLQSEDGSWGEEALGGNVPGGRIQATSQALTRLGYLGFGSEHKSVQKGAEFLFSKQNNDGSWHCPSVVEKEETAKESYTMMSLRTFPLQTALPLRGLVTCGYATDERAEKAYDWLVKQRLDDGSWPTYVTGNIFGYVAGYRRLAHSRWGCRSNTTASLICLAFHPKRRFSNEARRALDLLLGRETRERQNIGFEIARIIGIEPPSGFITFFAKFDLALILDLCWRVGADLGDERVAEIVEYIKQSQGPYGLWDYIPRPEASRWVTFDLLRSLSRLDKETNWLSLEPRTPFAAYLRRPKRF
jgi:hypothetical protein